MLTFDEVNDFTVKEWWKYGEILSDFNRYPEYYNNYLTSRGVDMLYEEQYPEISWIFNDKEYRYLEFELKGDFITVFYRNVYRACRVNFIDLPVSKGSNKSNEEYVFRELIKKKFVSCFFVDENRALDFDCIEISESNRCYEKDNFYSDYNFFESYFTKRRIKKYRIEDLRMNLSARTSCGSIGDLRDDAIFIYDSWSKDKGGTARKGFLKAVRYNSDCVYFRVYYYKGLPVCVSMLMDIGMDFVVSIYRYVIRCSDFKYEDGLAILNRLSLYTRYSDLLFLDNCNGRRIYSLGTSIVGKNNGLYRHKKSVNRGYLRFYKIKESDVK